jgi:long-chain acyl-CoA synthetase
MNIAQFLAKSAQAFPEQPALTVGTQVVSSYAACAETASRIAGFLRGSLGLATGESVAIGMTNSPAFYEVLFGIWHAGLVAVPMNAKLHANELAYIIENAEARAAFVSGGLASVVGPLGSRAGRLIHVIDADAPEYRRVCLADPLAPAHCDGGEPAWLFYTSGTTGRPKGATLTHRNLLLMTLSYFADIDSVHPEDCIIHAAPMSHGSGLYGLAHVAKAANNVIPESGGFEPIEIFDLWRRHQSVTMFAAPTMIVRLLGAAGSAPEPRNLKLLCYGGGPMYVEDTLRALDAFGPRLAQVYGQGESPMTITALSRAVHADRAHPRYLERLGSVGIARTDVEVRVVDEEGRERSPGEVGEVVVRGDVVMAGYWRNPTATASAIRNGWLHTGDLGCFDADGYLMLKDRSKDLIISGGANIYPREVEEALLRHPAVLETVVVGRRHPEWGEEVVAFVTIRPGHSADVAALDAHCLNHIARFKRPREYRFVEVLPKNDYGKVLKRVLRESLAAEQATARSA